jgi:hypothetical protein
LSMISDYTIQKFPVNAETPIPEYYKFTNV